MSLDATVRWLVRLQHPAGSWTDFRLAPGPSDGWVTAYTGTALALCATDPRVGAPARAVAGQAADAAACWLQRVAGPDGGWGWTRTVRPDADSTAWAVRLLALRGWPVPSATLDFLAAHRADGGYRTYRSTSVSGAWASPTPEVTAAVLLARHAVGELDTAGLAEQWCALLVPALGEDGEWHSMWWSESAYPSAVVGAAWVAAGRPEFLRAPFSGLKAPFSPHVATSSWQLATRLWVAAAFRDGGAGWRAELADELMAGRRGDGGWTGQAWLRVPAQRADRIPGWSRDARGIFTTATALHALLAVEGVHAMPRRPGTASGEAAARRPYGQQVTARPPYDPQAARRPYDRLVGDVAAAAGVDTATAVTAFRALTGESLARPGVWPARQLSNLAGGTPLEFSVGSEPALRLTTEVGDPLLPPHSRVRSGLRAIRRTATLLGMAPAWRAVQPAVAVLTDQQLPVPDGCRFWVWAGMDLTPDGRAVLKTYLSLHGEDLPDWRGRERTFLAACGVPPDAPVHAVLDRLAEDGWCHEVGVGLAGGGTWGLKVYYELPGYQASTVREVLGMCGLDGATDGLAPEVPGVLRASLAAKRRSGIALRVHPGTGRVDEVTVAAAFPAPLVGRDATAARASSWLASVGSAGPHDATVAALEQDWRGAPPHARMHSLLTRSRSARRDETKVYLRPWVGGEGSDGDAHDEDSR